MSAHTLKRLRLPMTSDTEFCVGLNNVGKFLGEQWVLRGLSATMPASKVTALIGPSGCGKTTLLRLINGLYRPNEGQIDVMGKPIPDRNLHLFRRKIGLAVQGAGLFPHMTIEQNIVKLAVLTGWNRERIEGRLRELMELTDLDSSMQHRYPYELSGGQQHRVSLCRALMLEPKMVLLDEPFAAIDAITRREIQSAFQRLQQHLQFSAVLVTHDFREVTLLADHVVVLAQGGIVQHGPRDEVLAKPEPSFLQGLVESAT